MRLCSYSTLHPLKHTQQSLALAQLHAASPHNTPRLCLANPLQSPTELLQLHSRTAATLTP